LTACDAFLELAAAFGGLESGDCELEGECAVCGQLEGDGVEVDECQLDEFYEDVCW